MQDQLKGMADNLAPQLEEFATSRCSYWFRESLQGSVGSISDALKANSGAFANFGQGLVPTGL